MKDLTKGNIYKTFLLFAVPMVLSGVLSQCYSVVNTILAGKLLGDGALAAIGAVAPLDSFLNSFLWGYGTGVGIYTAHLFGAGKFFRMKSTIVSNHVFVTAFCILLSLLMLLFREQVFALLKVDSAVLEACDRYFTVNMLGKCVVLFTINCIYIFNAMGDSSYPFWMSVVSTVLNILISVLAITVFGLGVEGLALANVLAATAVSGLYILRFLRIFRQLGMKKHKVRVCFSVIRETARYSVFSMLQQSIMYFSGMILSPMINAIGSAASASYTVTLRIYDINASIYQNSGKTLGSYAAQAYGSRQYDRLKKGLTVGLVQGILFALPLMLICVCFPREVTMLFYSADASPVSVEYTVRFLSYCLPFLLFHVVDNLFHNFFRGIGRMAALLVSTATGSAVRILASCLLIPFWGIYGYYAGWVLSWVADALTGLMIYCFGKWRRILKADTSFAAEKLQF